MYGVSLLVFNHGFRFQDSVCNGCHDLTIFCISISDVTIITIKGVDYCYINKSEAVRLLENSELDDPRYT